MCQSKKGDKSPYPFGVRCSNCETKSPVEFLIGGFPCTDFWVAGKKEGFLNKQSNLFFEIVRLLRISPNINYFF